MQPDMTATFDTLTMTDVEGFWAGPRETREGVFAQLRASEDLFFSREPAQEIDGEIVFPEGPGFYSLVRHEDIVAASKQPTLFCSGNGTNITDLPIEMREFFGSMISMDDPRHARLRRVVAKGFTPRMVENETTRNSASHGLRLLTENPDQRALLMEDFEGRIGDAVEEIVRLSSPVIHFRRTVTQDGAQLGNHTFKQGDKVVLWYASANRDDRVFDRPHEMDITRDASAQVGFGGPGPHFCLGAHFARRQLATIFRELLHTLPDIKMVGEPDYLRSNFINGIKHMTAEFTPVSSA